MWLQLFWLFCRIFWIFLALWNFMSWISSEVAYHTSEVAFCLVFFLVWTTLLYIFSIAMFETPHFTLGYCKSDLSSFFDFCRVSLFQWFILSVSLAMSTNNSKDIPLPFMFLLSFFIVICCFCMIFYCDSFNCGCHDYAILNSPNLASIAKTLSHNWTKLDTFLSWCYMTWRLEWLQWLWI